MLCWSNTKKSKKVAIWGAIAIVCGVVLVISAIVFPIIITNTLHEEIPPTVAISKENEDSWNELPGKHNIEIVKQIYTYNCTNPEDVSISLGYSIDPIE